MSYLAIEGYHAFVTGALGGIGSAIVEELLGIHCLCHVKESQTPSTDNKNSGRLQSHSSRPAAL